MNWISGSLGCAGLIVCAACGAPASEAETTSKSYELNYRVTPDPATGNIAVTVTLDQDRRLLREMRFAANGEVTAQGGGTLNVDDTTAVWVPDADGGSLSWTVPVDHQRSNGGYDARLDADWGIFRAEDVIPRAATRTLKGATSATTLSFELPPGWSAVTEYSSLRDPIAVQRPGRRFSQPTGWIAVGKLGVRRETIAGTRVTVAGPLGHAVRRMDMLALLNWTLPELATLLGETPPRLTLVSASDPMWRGGLSAPASLFLHADRPLISENATSTLLHELMHVALQIDAAEGYDWIVEGLAEYYSLELLHRGGAITSRRYRVALEDQASWAEDATSLCGPSSRGATTALAVVVLRQTDEAVQAATQGKASLDDAVRRLHDSSTDVDHVALTAAIEATAGTIPAVLDLDNLPGCGSTPYTDRAADGARGHF